MSKVSEAVAELEDKVSGKFGSLRDKFLQAAKHGKKLIKKPKFQALKRGFAKKVMHPRSKVEIVADNPGETTVVKEQTSAETPACPNIDPPPPSDVLEVWFPGCHSGKYTPVLLILC